MKITGIVSEFNPFHNGHKYLVERARENGATHVVTVMGGSFLQRGNCAVVGKYERAKAAILGGVDLVLELPEIYACASAERFARGAVGVLEACGCVDTICCGAEYMNVSAQIRAIDILEGADVGEFLSKGYSYPHAVQAAVEKSGDEEIAALLRSPNDLLALEYFRAGKDDFSFLSVRRTAPHDSDTPDSGKYASASLIRKMIISGGDYREYVPETTAQMIERAKKEGACPARFENNERGVISVLRRMTAQELKRLPDVSEGLENRLHRAIHENDTLSGIIMATKCKRYTHARLSRIAACAYLGITAADIDKPPQYIRVLALNDRGAEILKEMKKTAVLPVLTAARSFGSLTKEARKTLDIDLRASDLFALCTPKLMRCGEDFYRGAVKI